MLVSILRLTPIISLQIVELNQLQRSRALRAPWCWRVVKDEVVMQVAMNIFKTERIAEAAANEIMEKFLRMSGL
jgi:hypothetical protein